MILKVIFTEDLEIQYKLDSVRNRNTRLAYRQIVCE